MQVQPSLKVHLDVYCRLTSDLDGRAGNPGSGHTTRPWFLEGPVVDDGHLYFVDLAWGRILRCDPDSSIDVIYRYDGEPNGLALDESGGFLVADRIHGLLRWDSDEGSLETLLPHADPAFPLQGLNDVILDTDGNIFVSDQGQSDLVKRTGRVLRYSDREVEIVLDSLPSPNGLALDETEDDLYIAVTRENAIWHCRLADGSPGRVGRRSQFSGGTGPDGLSLHNGHLMVAHLGAGAVWVLDPIGGVVAQLVSPQGLLTTNVTATDEGQIFVTEADTGSILTTELDDVLGRLE